MCVLAYLPELFFVCTGSFRLPVALPSVCVCVYMQGNSLKQIKQFHWISWCFLHWERSYIEQTGILWIVYCKINGPRSLLHFVKKIVGNSFAIWYSCASKQWLNHFSVEREKNLTIILMWICMYCWALVLPSVICQLKTECATSVYGEWFLSSSFDFFLSILVITLSVCV